METNIPKKNVVSKMFIVPPEYRGIQSKGVYQHNTQDIRKNHVVQVKLLLNGLSVPLRFSSSKNPGDLISSLSEIKDPPSSIRSPAQIARDQGYFKILFYRLLTDSKPKVSQPTDQKTTSYPSPLLPPPPSPSPPNTPSAYTSS